MKKIILTGGGTAGHVIPNLTLLPHLKSGGYEVSYIGSHGGIERSLIEYAGVPYYGISSGKLRRYFDLRNLTDFFRVIKGVFDAIKILRRVKPDMVFSKGGFVVVPVIAAARLLGIKSVIHESDLTPGLANRLVMPFAAKVCVSFPETLAYVPRQKAALTGIPLRDDLHSGDRLRGLKFAGFEPDGNPVLIITGGSQGSAGINACVREALHELLKVFRVIHLCGRGHLSDIKIQGYTEFEVLNKDLPDVLAAGDIVVSRAGANTIYELLALRKPNLLIPLPMGASRGDQIINAASFKSRGFSAVLRDEDMTPESLVKEVLALYDARDNYISAMSAHEFQDSAKAIINILNEISS